jgi:hypothetical protein
MLASTKNNIATGHFAAVSRVVEASTDMQDATRG